MSGDPFASQRAAFRRLHESGCFILPNPWDTGSARWLAHLGFRALATTSAGFAWTQGYPDSNAVVPRDMVLNHMAEMAEAAGDLPVNADFENGYADAPDDVAANMGLAIKTGVAGVSIEDNTGRSDAPLYELPLAVERIRAARAAIDASGRDVLLVARAEAFLTGHPEPLREAVTRLEAFAEAGADVLYAPGLKTAEEIATVVRAVRPRPVNILLNGANAMSLSEAEALGVRRISVGAALARAAWAAFIRAAAEMAAHGTFGGFAQNADSQPLNGFFARDLKARIGA